ncbi:MAG: DNA mismatch repair protein MutS, partial [Clostridia bacterium]|nr:DNA mismatch repair protein MutS [Clostridia bacterium]
DMAMSPMMQQYLQIKEEHKDCLLMFRLGDFYELFFDDAKTVSEELQLVLTARDSGDGQRAPMCGVPHHAVEGYLTKLISRGYRVAICEQLEDPSAAKGIVKRGVVRIVTPGTVTEGGFLKDECNNYLAAVSVKGGDFGLAFADVSTGEIFATEAVGDDSDALLTAECAAFAPAEVVLGSDTPDTMLTLIKKRTNALTTPFDGDGEDLLKEKGCIEAEGFTTDLAERAAALLLGYIRGTQKTDLDYIKPIRYYLSRSFMRLDGFTRRNLELTEAMRTGEKKGSLLWVLDKTCTGMGARLLKQWVDRPLLSSGAINKRLAAVEELKGDTALRKELRSLLKSVVDMERITTRLVYGSANARDLRALESSANKLPAIKKALAGCKSAPLERLYSALDTLEDIERSIASNIADDPPVTLKEGGIIKQGANALVDELRAMMTDGREWISKIEANEKQKTGIRTLKVGYNKVFGYYIEVSKSFCNDVPENYIRRQTLANCERFVTPELKDMESRVIGAKDKVCALEYELFSALRDYIIERIPRIQASAAAVAETDVYLSLAEVAATGGYVR